MSLKPGQYRRYPSRQSGQEEEEPRGERPVNEMGFMFFADIAKRDVSEE